VLLNFNVGGEQLHGIVIVFSGPVNVRLACVGQLVPELIPGTVTATATVCPG